ncbi:hypothetical protein ACJROX_20680 [Pseudalkalibacillus sp. A8]|uniref:hypothetical protein n=1 Tax=Pseudalkalibacillus sp. A8 TaxID=3382641 RepID=UPI0038B53F02
MTWLPFKKKYPIFLVFQDDCIRYVKLKSRSIDRPEGWGENHPIRGHTRREDCESGAPYPTA